MNRNKIIITGATGFIGSNLVRFLVNKGFDIGIIIRSTSEMDILSDVKKNLKILYYDGNIEQIIQFFEIEKPSIVIHTASNFLSQHNPSDINSLIDSNIKFGTHILEAMRVSGVENLINTGTSWQHYDNEEYNPVCLYAATKEAYQKLIDYYTSAENFKAITLKLFDTYGETDRRLKIINLLDKFSRNGGELEMSYGEQLLNLTHVNNILDAFNIAIQLIHSKEDKGHQIYSLSSATNHSLKKVVEIFEKATDRRINIVWGAREYRKREVMFPWNKGVPLPGWSERISLEEGLQKFK